jgi:hypothetical protein
MPVYYMLLDPDLFFNRMSPALAASWQTRSFAPCRALCCELAPAVYAFTKRFHTGPEEPLISSVPKGLPFDRHFWQLLAGEFLLYGATEIPEIQTVPAALCALLAPGHYRQDLVARTYFAPIQQVHFGTRQLLFGTRCYRPEQAGYNDVGDVARLAGYLAAQRPERWTVADLAELGEVGDDEELQEELEFAREWFPALCELYQRAQARRQLIVCECL